MSDDYHKDPADCPTWHDGCNCTVETCVNLSKLLDAAETRVRELEERLQFDPGGSDKIDELEASSQFLRHSRDVAEARVEELEGAIREAVKTAGRRWSEWGGRAESVEKILDDAIMAAVEQAEEGK